jgi:hypothetical protein
MHPLLTGQKINYGIYVVEQLFKNDTGDFNRGLLLNIGFLEALNDQLKNQPHLDWDCFIFHDVDFFPMSKKNLYRCNQNHPVHMSTSPEQADNRSNWLVNILYNLV